MLSFHGCAYSPDTGKHRAGFISLLGPDPELKIKSRGKKGKFGISAPLSTQISIIGVITQKKPSSASNSVRQIWCSWGPIKTPHPLIPLRKRGTKITQPLSIEWFVPWPWGKKGVLAHPGSNFLPQIIMGPLVPWAQKVSSRWDPEKHENWGFNSNAYAKIGNRGYQPKHLGRRSFFHMLAAASDWLPQKSTRVLMGSRGIKRLNLYHCKVYPQELMLPFQGCGCSADTEKHGADLVCPLGLDAELETKPRVAKKKKWNFYPFIHINVNNRGYWPEEIKLSFQLRSPDVVLLRPNQNSTPSHFPEKRGTKITRPVPVERFILQPWVRKSVLMHPGSDFLL